MCPALTARQMQLAAQVAQGKCNKDVAVAMGLTPLSVRVALSRIYRRMGFEAGGSARLQLALWFLARQYE